MLRRRIILTVIIFVVLMSCYIIADGVMTNFETFDWNHALLMLVIAFTWFFLSTIKNIKDDL